VNIVEVFRPQPLAGSCSAPLRQIDQWLGAKGWPVLRYRPAGFRRLARMEQAGMVKVMGAFDLSHGKHDFAA